MFVVLTRNLASVRMAQTSHPHGNLLSLPPDHRVRLGPTTPWTRPPTPMFQKGRPTRSTYFRRLCGKTSIMPRKTRLIRPLRTTHRTGLRHLVRQAQVACDRGHLLPMFIIHIILLLHALQVSIHPLVPLIPFPRLPKLTFPRSTENGVVSLARVQVVQYAL